MYRDYNKAIALGLGLTESEAFWFKGVLHWVFCDHSSITLDSKGWLLVNEFLEQQRGGVMEIKIEGTLQDVFGQSCLVSLAKAGNPAALLALRKGKYTFQDAPFYYVKINGLGHIVSHKDLKSKKGER